MRVSLLDPCHHHILLQKSNIGRGPLMRLGMAKLNLGLRTCTSSLYTSTYGQLIPEFGSSRLVCTLGLSLFVAGLGTGPMILSPLSEVRSSA